MSGQGPGGEIEMTMTSKRYPWFRGAWTAVAFTMAVAGATALLFRNPSVATTETVGFVFLVFVTLAAFFGNGASSIAVSLVATLCFDYFFLPPAGTLDIASPADWISLGAFLLIAVTIGRLTASAASAKESNRKLMDEMGLLAALGRPLASPADLTLTAIAEEVVSVGHFPYCSLHVYRGGRWDHAVGSARAGVAARVEEKLLQ